MMKSPSLYSILSVLVVRLPSFLYKNRENTIQTILTQYAHYYPQHLVSCVALQEVPNKSYWLPEKILPLSCHSFTIPTSVCTDFLKYMEICINKTI